MRFCQHGYEYPGSVNLGNILMAEELQTSEEGLCSMVLVHTMRVIVSCAIQIWS